MKGRIYCYTLDDGRQYIGQTIYPMNIRNSQHKRGDQVIDRCIRKHDYHIFIIGEYDESLLDYKEQQFIEIFNTLYPNGLNMNSGGSLNHHPSEETKKKMSESRIKMLTENPMSDETKERMSIAKKEYYKNNPYALIKLKNLQTGKIPWNKGKKVEDEEIRKKCYGSLKEYYKTHEVWNKGKKGIHNSPESEFKKIRIFCETTGKEYQSLSDAARDVGCSISALSICCKKGRGTVKGYVWVKLDD